MNLLVCCGKCKMVCSISLELDDAPLIGWPINSQG